MNKPYYTVLNYTHFTKTFTSLPLCTLHITPCLNSLPFTAYSLSSPHFKFTSHITFQPLFLEILSFLRTSNSLHLASLTTFPTFSPFMLDFPTLQIPFTSLITFLPLILETVHFLLTSNPLHFTYHHLSAPYPGNSTFPPHFKFPSLHFTYHFPNSLLKVAQFRGESLLCIHR